MSLTDFLAFEMPFNTERMRDCISYKIDLLEMAEKSVVDRESYEGYLVQYTLIMESIAEELAKHEREMWTIKEKAHALERQIEAAEGRNAG